MIRVCVWLEILKNMPFRTERIQPVSEGTVTPNPWEAIPLSEDPNLSVIRDGTSGNIVATTPREYADAIATLPELVRASEALLERFKGNWRDSNNAVLVGSLESAIRKIQKRA